MRHCLLAIVVTSFALAGCEWTHGLPPVPPGVAGDCSPGVLEALEAGNRNRINDLVRRGASITCFASSRLLETAVHRGRIDELRFLLEAGIDPHRGTGEFRGTPNLLAMALARRPDVQRGLDMAALLMQYGFDINKARLSWRHGTRIGYADDSGEPYETYAIGVSDATYLMVAVMDGERAFAAGLIDLGIDIHARDSRGRTALDLAREHQPEMVDLLSDAEMRSHSRGRRR